MTMRRLAAILAADVVGFSRFIGEHEAGTLAALREIRKGRCQRNPSLSTLRLKCSRCGSRDVERQVTWGAPTVEVWLVPQKL